MLDHGALGEAAYGALFRMREVGLALVACTGRPAGWADVLARQWPIDGAIAENGAIAFVRREAEPGRAAVLERIDPLPAAERRARRAKLLALAEELVARCPEAALTDDNDARASDVTIDVGEHRRVPEPVVAALCALAHARGVRTFVSSVHLHLTLEPEDKASGAVALLARRFGEDRSSALARFAYVGDSLNDAVAFAAFRTTFGVANVAPYVQRLTVPPCYVAASPMGAGFAEIAARLVALRR